jgi:hypothetical protein
MGYVASLHSLLVKLLERAREWSPDVKRVGPPERDDDSDNFLDIFLFGPHG